MSDAAEIAVSYDVSNDFYRLWLDAGMNYSCALFDGVGTLEEAQRQKLEWICDAARVTPQKRVLDVGCGWGGALAHLTRVRGVRAAHGITLSRNQHDDLLRRLSGVTVTLCSYLDYRPSEPFDAIISIGMLEHVATPEQARAGAHVEAYRDYFRRAHEWTTPGAWFGLQLVHAARLPRRREDIRLLAWGTRTIFPGAITPRIEDVVRSLQPWWELVELRTRGADYARTAAAWHERLCANEAEIRRRWGDELFQEYERYLRGCVRMFDRRYLTLGQYALRRLDGPEHEQEEG